MKIVRHDVQREMTCKKLGEAFAASGYQGCEPIAMNQDTNEILWHDVPGKEWGISSVTLEEHIDGVIRAEHSPIPKLSFCAQPSGGELYDLDRVEYIDHLDYFIQRSIEATRREVDVLGINIERKQCLWYDHMTGMYMVQRYARVADEIEFIGLPVSIWMPD